MVFLRTVVRSAVLVGLCSAWLQAQRTHARVNVAPQGRPRVATIAPPPPTPAQPTYSPTVFSNLPAIVLDDGRVLIDRGNAYELVGGTCPNAYGYGCESLVYPNVLYVPLVYEPPVYVVPYYVAPVYPSGGYDPYGAYPEWYRPPAYGVCGGCRDPWVTRRSSTSVPVSGPAQAAPRPTPAQAARAPRVLPPIHR